MLTVNVTLHPYTPSTSFMPPLAGEVAPVSCLSLNPDLQQYIPTETQSETFCTHSQYCAPGVPLGP